MSETAVRIKCPKGHSVPVESIHSYVSIKEKVQSEENITFSCPGGKRGHNFNLQAAVKAGMFNQEQALKIIAEAQRISDSI